MEPQLFALRLDFSALVPINKLRFPEKVSLSRMNRFFVEDILLDYHSQKYPPSAQYQISFWKWAIQHLEELVRHIPEDEEGEIVSPIYEHYIGLLSLSKWNTSSGTVPPSPSYVTYFWHPGEFGGLGVNTDVANVHEYSTATLLESRTTIENGTTGLRTWLASFLLAQYLIQNPDLVVSKRVLELGTGVGFLGIIVASLQQMKGRTQPGTLWLTDINNEVLQRCRENLGLPCNPSSSHPSVNFIKLDWCNSLVNAESPYNLNPSSIMTVLIEEIHPDLVIGADIVFDPSLVPGLVRTIKICLNRRACCALIALTVRNESTLSCFLSHLQEFSLLAEQLALPVARSFFHRSVEIEAKDIIILQITTQTSSTTNLYTKTLIN